MTVTYTREVATAKKFGIFWKLIFRWKGSIYKLIWPEMFMFILLYYCLRCIYDYALNVDQRRTFEDISLYCQNFTDMIPVTFVLGFYVNIVMTRWWDQYKTIPWPDNLAVFVSTSIQGLDERGRVMRRTIMRYVNLAFVMTLSMVSPRVKKRFPTKEHLVEAGIMTKNEKKIIENMDELYHQPTYWMPLVWAGTIASRARREGRIRDDFAVKTILDTINTFREGCGGLIGYDRISVPLVYTQVVTLAVYSFCIGTLMGRQYLDPTKGYPKNSSDLYVPWFTILQFLFYMGWLKVAESLINPFGEDDDDFDINWLIDRDIQLSYLIVDYMHSEHPELVQDKYWDEGIPQDLPYTVASEQYKTGPHLGSTAEIEVPQYQQCFLKRVPEDEESDEGGYEEDCACNTPRSRKKSFRRDKEGGNIKLNTVDNKDNLESDMDSVIWVTPRSIPRNQSILSMIRNQLSQNPNQHRRLSKQISSSSHEGTSKRSEIRKQSSVESPLLSRGPSFKMEKNMESAIFRISLESLEEEDQTSKSELDNNNK